MWVIAFCYCFKQHLICWVGICFIKYNIPFFTQHVTLKGLDSLFITKSSWKFCYWNHHIQMHFLASFLQLFPQVISKYLDVWVRSPINTTYICFLSFQPRDSNCYTFHYIINHFRHTFLNRIVNVNINKQCNPSPRSVNSIFTFKIVTFKVEVHSFFVFINPGFWHGNYIKRFIKWWKVILHLIKVGI